MPKRKHPKTALYFTTVVAVEDQVAIIGGHLYGDGDDPSTTRISVCDRGTWGDLGDLDDIVYSLARKPDVSRKPVPTVCIMGRQGKYRELATKKPAVDTKIDIVDSGFVLGLKYIGKHLYACGTQNRVLMQVRGDWIRIDKGIYSPLEDEIDRSLNAIDGFSDHDIYAVGDCGIVLHWNGRKWRSIASPTSLSLYSVLCASSGDVYVAGAGGVMFRRTGKKPWVKLGNAAVTTEAIESLAEHKERIYAACHEALLLVEDDKLGVLKVPLRGKHAYDALSSSSELLWCVGDESVLVFDGVGWRKYVCPDNE